MAGLLGDIYSYGNTLKRKVNGLLADPAGTAQQFVGQLGDDTNAQINNMLVGYGMFGNKSVLADPKQVQQARNALADYGAQTGIAGMFVGKGSKTWDAINAKKAEELAAKGVDPRKIWQETGTWKGPDGMWRQEVDDSGARPGRAVNWTGFSVVSGMVGLAIFTMPYGLVIIAAMVWVWRRG